MPDFIPSADADFDGWFQNFSNFITAAGAGLGLAPGDITTISSEFSAWHAAYVAQVSIQAQAKAKAATQAKNEERDDAETIVRQFARMVQANPNVTNAQRAAAGLTVPDAQPTASSPADIDTTAPPIVLLDWSQRSRVIIHFGQNPSNERINALPAGMRGCRLYYAIGGIPANEADWKYLVDDVRSPYIHVLTVTQPTTIAYRAQYFDRQMRLGPMSDPATATVTV